jgi:hypothetical protein
VLNLGAVQERNDDDHRGEHHEHDRERHDEPLEERDRLAGFRLEQVASDQVGGLPIGSRRPPTVMP